MSMHSVKKAGSKSFFIAFKACQLLQKFQGKGWTGKKLKNIQGIEAYLCHQFLSILYWSNSEYWSQSRIQHKLIQWDHNSKTQEEKYFSLTRIWTTVLWKWKPVCQQLAMLPLYEANFQALFSDKLKKVSEVTSEGNSTALNVAFKTLPCYIRLMNAIW